MANKKYKLTDGNYWATDGIHDFGQNKTQREINAALVQADSDLSGAINSKAPIASPTFTGTPKSVTPTSGDDTTNIATTAFVQSAATNRIYYKLIASNGTLTIQTGSGHSYMILGFRVSSIAQNHVWYAIDPWGGILKLSETTAVTVTFSTGIVTVTNNSGGYLPLLVIDFYEI